MKRKVLSILLVLTMAMGIIVSFPHTTHAIESTGNDKIDEFLSDKRFTAGAPWGSRKMPYLSSYSCWGCCAFTVDYVKYCYGANQPRTGKAFTDVSEIRAGDVLTVGNQSNGSGHWFVCLKRDGDKLYVAEGNWQNKVRVGWNYTISGKGFAEERRSFNTGYHYLDETSLTGKAAKDDDKKEADKPNATEKPKATETPAPTKEHKHDYKTTVVKKATMHSNGKLRKKCTVCGKKHSNTIYSPKKVTPDKSTFTGNKGTADPKVVVKNTNGKVISSKYYSLTYKTNKKTNKVKATVTFKRRYKGTKSLKFKISEKSKKENKKTKKTNQKKQTKQQQTKQQTAVTTTTPTTPETVGETVH